MEKKVDLLIICKFNTAQVELHTRKLFALNRGFAFKGINKRIVIVSRSAYSKFMIFFHAERTTTHHRLCDTPNVIIVYTIGYIFVRVLNCFDTRNEDMLFISAQNLNNNLFKVFLIGIFCLQIRRTVYVSARVACVNRQRHAIPFVISHVTCTNFRLSCYGFFFIIQDNCRILRCLQVTYVKDKRVTVTDSLCIDCKTAFAAHVSNGISDTITTVLTKGNIAQAEAKCFFVKIQLNGQLGRAVFRNRTSKNRAFVYLCACGDSIYRFRQINVFACNTLQLAIFVKTKQACVVCRHINVLQAIEVGVIITACNIVACILSRQNLYRVVNNCVVFCRNRLRLGDGLAEIKLFTANVVIIKHEAVKLFRFRSGNRCAVVYGDRRNNATTFVNNRKSKHVEVFLRRTVGLHFRFGVYQLATAVQFAKICIGLNGIRKGRIVVDFPNQKALGTCQELACGLRFIAKRQAFVIKVGFGEFTFAGNVFYTVYVVTHLINHANVFNTSNNEHLVAIFGNLTFRFSKNFRSLRLHFSCAYIYACSIQRNRKGHRSRKSKTKNS